jgi:hypothetical protein
VFSLDTIEGIWFEGQQMSLEEIIAYSQKDGESDE